MRVCHRFFLSLETSFVMDCKTNEQEISKIYIAEMENTHKKNKCLSCCSMLFHLENISLCSEDGKLLLGVQMNSRDGINGSLKRSGSWCAVCFYRVIFYTILYFIEFYIVFKSHLILNEWHHFGVNMCFVKQRPPSPFPPAVLHSSAFVWKKTKKNKRRSDCPWGLEGKIKLQGVKNNKLWIVHKHRISNEFH